MMRLTRRVKAAEAAGDLSGLWLRPYMKPRKLKPGTVLFRKGDPARPPVLPGRRADRAGGDRRGAAAGQDLRRDRLLRARPAAHAHRALRRGGARCWPSTRPRVKQLVYQNPSLGFHLMGLVAGRLSEDIRRYRAAPGRRTRPRRLHSIEDEGELGFARPGERGVPWLRGAARSFRRVAAPEGTGMNRSSNRLTLLARGIVPRRERRAGIELSGASSSVHCCSASVGARARRTGAAGRRARVHRSAGAGLHAPGPARTGLRRGAERGLCLPLGRRRPARSAGPGAPSGQPEAGRAVLRRAGGAGRGGACHQQRADRRARPGDRPAAQRAGALGGAAAHQRHRARSSTSRPLPASGSSCCARRCHRRRRVNLLWDASTGPWQLAAAKNAAQQLQLRRRHAGGARRGRVRAGAGRRHEPQARSAGAAVVAAGARSLEADRRVLRSSSGCRRFRPSASSRRPAA